MARGASGNPAVLRRPARADIADGRIAFEQAPRPRDWFAAQRGFQPVAAQFEPHRRDMFRGLLATINRCWIDTRVSLGNSCQGIHFHLQTSCNPPPAPAAPFVLGAAMAGVAAVVLLVAVPGESVGSAALIADDDTSILLDAIN